MAIKEHTVEQMIDELTKVATRHSGEEAHVKILTRNDVSYIQITIAHKTILDIEFHQLDVPRV